MSTILFVMDVDIIWGVCFWFFQWYFICRCYEVAGRNRRKVTIWIGNRVAWLHKWFSLFFLFCFSSFPSEHNLRFVDTISILLLVFLSIICLTWIYTIVKPLFYRDPSGQQRAGSNPVTRQQILFCSPAHEICLQE